ncbi:hypothetical protein B0O99DRAFT_633264 [Bisporella sp. PMI_857]|nr:hypothetical protein B0O99DRAFT_633264 [Bisporella sp. PMI_857]
MTNIEDTCSLGGRSSDKSRRVRRAVDKSTAEQKHAITPRPKLVPAGALSSGENEILIRKRLRQHLPKARRPVVRNRIELCLPANFTEGPGDYHTSDLTQNHYWTGSHRQEDRGKQLEPHTPNSRMPYVSLPNPMTVLDTSRSDPFTQYPIPMTSRERWLLDQLRVDINKDPVFSTYRTTWLPTAVKDATSFYQFLANVSLSLYHAYGRDGDYPVSAMYHALALRAVNEKLSNPEMRASEAVVYSVAGFICWTFYNKDRSDFDFHVNGLAKILDLRGGLESLDFNPSLRCMVFGLDLSAACSRDTRPRFKFPDRVLSNGRSSLLRKLYNYHDLSEERKPLLLQTLPNGHSLNRTYDDILVAIGFINYKTDRGESWKNVKFLTYWVDPILHILVGMPYDVTANRGSYIMEEMTRLGFILFLCKLRRISGQMGVETQLYVTKLKKLISMAEMDSHLVKKDGILLWVLFMGMVESLDSPEGAWFRESTAQIAFKMGWLSWNSLIATAKSYIWVDLVFGDELKILQHSYEHLLLELPAALEN